MPAAVAPVNNQSERVQMTTCPLGLVVLKRGAGRFLIHLFTTILPYIPAGSMGFYAGFFLISLVKRHQRHFARTKTVHIKPSGFVRTLLHRTGRRLFQSTKQNRLRQAYDDSTSYFG